MHSSAGRGATSLVSGSEHKKTLDYLCEHLSKGDDNYTHTGVLTNRNAGVSIVSRFPFVDARAVNLTTAHQRKQVGFTADTNMSGKDGRFTTRCMTAVLDTGDRGNEGGTDGDDGEDLLRILGVHLDHVTEDMRIAQWNAIMPEVRRYWQGHLPDIIAGDFNALTRSDYTEEEWKAIGDTRSNNSWEAPVSALTTMISGQRPGKNEGGKAAGKRSGKHKESRRHIGPAIPTKYTDAWAQAGRKGVKTTCRFDTRIDYIFYDKVRMSALGLSRLVSAYAYSSDISDHNLVCAVFRRREHQEMPEAQDETIPMDTTPNPS